MDELKTCFVIAPIGEPDSEIRKRSDQVLKYIIAPALKDCGYEPLRADQISEPGIITTQVIQHILNDPLVVADLTGRNPNVFYELAIRHAIQKPLVQIIGKGEQIPFDVAATRIIFLNHQDLDSVDEAKSQIIRQIRALTKDPTKIDSPISTSIDLQILKQSNTPEQRSLADLIETISEMNIGIKRIQNDLSSEALYENKKQYKDLAVAIERLIMDTFQALRDFQGISNWVLVRGLDAEELAVRQKKLHEMEGFFHYIRGKLDELKKLLDL